MYVCILSNQINFCLTINIKADLEIKSFVSSFQESSRAVKICMIKVMADSAATTDELAKKWDLSRWMEKEITLTEAAKWSSWNVSNGEQTRVRDSKLLKSSQIHKKKQK